MATGSQPGMRRGGRQKGTPNKATTERLEREKAARAIKIAAINAGTYRPNDGSNDSDSIDCHASDPDTLASLLGPDTSPEAVQAALLDASDGTTTVDEALAAKLGVRVNNAHELLQYVYRDPRRPMAQRLDAAKTAIRYETPALSATTLQTEETPASRLRKQDTRAPLHDTIQQLLAANGARVDVVTTQQAPSTHPSKDINDFLRQVNALPNE